MAFARLRLAARNLRLLRETCAEEHPLERPLCAGHRDRVQRERIAREATHGLTRDGARRDDRRDVHEGHARADDTVHRERRRAEREHVGVGRAEHAACTNDRSAEARVEAALQTVAAGFRALKLRFHSEDYRDDVKTLALEKVRMGDLSTLAHRPTFQRGLAHHEGMWRAARLLITDTFCGFETAVAAGAEVTP